MGLDDDVEDDFNIHESVGSKVGAVFSKVNLVACAGELRGSNVDLVAGEECVSSEVDLTAIESVGQLVDFVTEKLTSSQVGSVITVEGELVDDGKLLSIVVLVAVEGSIVDLVAGEE